MEMVALSLHGCHNDQDQNELQGPSNAIFLSLVTQNYKFFKNCVFTKSTAPWVSPIELYPPKIYSFIHKLSQYMTFNSNTQKHLLSINCIHY